VTPHAAGVPATLHLPGALDLVCVAFDAARFDAARFAREAVALPPAIARAVPKRQAEFFHGRLCARAALARHGVAGADIAIGARREPVWPDGYAGSITHTHGIAAAVALPLRDCGGVGIDIETIASGSAVAALSRVAVSARELARLRPLTDDVPLATLLTLVFSAKESFYKSVSAAAGRVLGFNVVEIAGIDLAAGRMTFEVMQPVTPRFCPGAVFTVDCALLDGGRVLTGLRWV
jgi:4'-phosphopantetheinyl transferase EntD